MEPICAVMDERVYKDNYATKANSDKKTINIVNYSSDYIKKADRCIVSDVITYTIESKKIKQKKEKKQYIKKKEDKQGSKQLEVYTQQLELSSGDIEDSFHNNSGDLFQIQQMEDYCFEELEDFFHNNSGDLFRTQQIEWIEETDSELSMVLDNPDLFSVEIYQVDFEELNEEEIRLAEASMWNETGEVIFE